MATSKEVKTKFLFREVQFTYLIFLLPLIPPYNVLSINKTFLPINNRMLHPSGLLSWTISSRPAFGDPSGLPDSLRRPPKFTVAPQEIRDTVVRSPLKLTDQNY